MFNHTYSGLVAFNYTVSQKVLTVKLSVTLTNLDRFSKFLHCWKAHEICYKIHVYGQMGNVLWVL